MIRTCAHRATPVRPGEIRGHAWLARLYSAGIFPARKPFSRLRAELRRNPAGMPQVACPKAGKQEYSAPVLRMAQPQRLAVEEADLDHDSNVSADSPDWSREAIRRFWDPGPRLLRAIRRYQAAQAGSGPLAALAAKYWVLVHGFWSVITQSEIHLHTSIAGGLRLPHPSGIIIHPGSTIGPNCMIFHQVTLSSPVILGGHVDIGAGAKLIGPLTVGDHVTIGANAVVTGDVPDGATMVGIPARPVKPHQS